MIKLSGSGFSHWSNKCVLSSNVNTHQQCMKSTLPTLEMLRWQILSRTFFILFPVCPWGLCSLVLGMFGSLLVRSLCTHTFLRRWVTSNNLYTFYFGKWKWVNGSQMWETLQVSQPRGVIVISVFLHQSPHLSFRTYSTKPQNKKIKRSPISGETLNTVKLTVSALKLLFLYVQVLKITKIKRWTKDWWEGGGAVFFLSIFFSYLLLPF